MLKQIERNKGTLDFHTHPHDDDCVPSNSDKTLMKLLKKLTEQKTQIGYNKKHSYNYLHERSCMARKYDYANLFEKADKEIDLLQDTFDKQDQEIYIEIKMALVEIKQLCEADEKVPIWEVVQKYYDNALTHLLSSQKKKLKDAEKHCVLQKETPEETAKIMENVKRQIQAETNRFKTQYNYLFDALNLKQKEDLTIVPI